MIGGMLVSFVLAAFAIRYYVDQVIVGIVLNVLVIGITNFLYSKVLVPTTPTCSTRPRISRISDPGTLGDPDDRAGPVPADDHRLPDVHRGRRWSASGCSEPDGGSVCGRWASIRPPPTPSASTCGRTRFWNVSLAGAIAGMGGAFYTLDRVGSLQQADDGRCRIHRPGRGDLRTLGPDPGHPRRSDVRVRHAIQTCWPSSGRRFPASSC